MDVTRRGALPVLSDGPLAAFVVCTGALENVDLRSEKVCAYSIWRHPPAEVVSNVPDLIATPLIFLYELALSQPRHRHCTLYTCQVVTHVCESAILVYQIE
jgi:hypothetical protein